MKALIALTLFAAGVANAYDFAPASDGSYTCSTYCMGFVTDDPAHVVNSVTIVLGDIYGNLRATVTVDGVSYRTGAAVPNFDNPTLAIATDNSGRSVYVTLTYHVRITGTGKYRRTWFDCTGGTVQ